MSDYTIANLIRAAFSMTLVLLTIGCMQEPEQQVLLLEEQIEGLHKIYTVYPDGSQLTKTLEFRGNLYWLSPNGKHIALFAWRRENPLVALDGSLTIIDVISGDIVEKIEPVGVQIEHLLNSERVIWSPEGDKLLFIKDSTNGEGTDIWLYDLNTRRTSQLTADSSLNWAPAWSPDEEQIAFMRWEACNQSVWECPPEEQVWDLVIMDVDGSNQRIIIDFQDSELLPQRDWIGAWLDNLLCDLSWSPDSQYIVMRNNCGWLPGFRYNGLAFLVKTDGSHIQRLTDFIEEVETDDDFLSPENVTTYTFDWFNSSNNLFIGYTVARFPPRHFEGFLIVDTNDFSYVSFRETFATVGVSATWSPNKQYVIGSRVYEDGSSDSQMEIVLAKWDNNQGAVLPITDQLPKGSYSEREFYWSPDSQYVAYTLAESNDSGQGIVIVSPYSGQMTNVIGSQPIGWISSKEVEP